MKLRVKLKPKMGRSPRAVMDRLASAVRRKGPPEALVGLGRFVANPRRFGGFVSSSALAAAITQQIEPTAGPVLELGPGTGVFTRALLARGVAERDLILVETDPLLATRLRNAFPQALVLAQRAGSVTPEMLGGRRPVAVISGLPLLNFPGREVERIIATAFALCMPGAALYQFTYGPRCPVREKIMLRLGLVARRTARVWRNVPPASVYRIEERQ